MLRALAVVLMVLGSVEAASAVDRLVSTKGNDQGGANPCNPLPCRTVVHALAQAVSGDIIKVAKGVYKGSAAITESGTWTIRGGYGADFSEATRDVVKNKTTVNGAKGNRFLLVHAESGDAITVALDGLVVSNSKTDFSTPTRVDGGGILALAEGGSIDLDLSGVAMTSNSSLGFGGAMALSSENGSIMTRITGSLFKNNRTPDGSGGAIDARGFTGGTVDVTIENSRFEGNRAFSGGAITMEGRDTPGVTATIRRSLFINNTATGHIGGALEVRASEFPTGSSALATLTVANSVLQGNSAADSDGGAIGARAFVFESSGPHGTANVFVDLRNNTIAANKAANIGGAFEGFAFAPDGAPVGSSAVTGTLLNNIIRGNTAKAFPPSGDIVFISSGDGASTSFNLTTNNIGLLANFGTLTATPDPQLDVNPQLVKKQGIFRLKATSPMIDAGTCDGAPADDFEGDARPTGTGLCGVDIGADQFVGVP